MYRLVSALFAVALILVHGPAAHATEPSFAVRVQGKGPAMILIPGFLSSGAVWDDVVAHYQTRYECHVLTLPGFAGQPAMTTGPILERMRDEIVDYIKTKKLEDPVLVGHSMGGFLALWIAATSPDDVGSVVSVDGVPFFSALLDPNATADAARAQADGMRQLYTSMTTDQLAIQSRMAFASMMSDASRVDAAVEWARQSDPKAAGAMIAELMATDLRETVRGIRAPVLLIGAVKAFASAPGGVDRARAAYERQVAGIRLHDVALATEALHFVMYDDLPFLLKSTDAFLARTTAGKER